MDDFLLMPLEDLSIFEVKGILDMDYIYDGYYYWLKVVINDDATKKYREWSKKDGFDIYEGMERIYHTRIRGTQTYLQWTNN